MTTKLDIHKLLKLGVILILGVLFIFLMAIKKLPIPGTTIQLSLQSLSISILTITLERRAYKIVLIYLALATAGLPVLAGVTSDSLWLVSPSGGYYWGFLISSFVVAVILNKFKPKNFIKAWFCLSLNEGVILLCGYLVFIFYLGPTKAFWMGVWPYTIGAVLKITIATCYYILKRQLSLKKSSRQKWIFTS